MAHVTIIAKGYTEQWIKNAVEHYEKLGFKVDIVSDMNEAVIGILDNLKEW